jgi:hypothetical protein
MSSRSHNFAVLEFDEEWEAWSVLVTYAAIGRVEARDRFCRDLNEGKVYLKKHTRWDPQPLRLVALDEASVVLHVETRVTYEVE